jgi:hypothetical protein
VFINIHTRAVSSPSAWEEEDEEENKKKNENVN